MTTPHVYVRIDDVPEPDIHVAPIASTVEIPLSWVVSDDEADADVAPGAEPDSVPPDSDRCSSNVDAAAAAAGIQDEAFTPHANTEGHKAICSILLPALLSVMRDDEYKNHSPREQVRRACQRRTPGVSYFFKYVGFCFLFLLAPKVCDRLLMQTGTHASKLSLTPENNSGVAMPSTPGSGLQRIRLLNCQLMSCQPLK